MKKQFNLTTLPIARLSNGEPFLVAKNEELCLEFESGNYLTDNLIINLKNGKLSEKYKVSKNFQVPKEFLQGGELFVGVNLLVKGDVVKHWDCEPITIIETNAGHLLEGTFNEFRKELQELTQKYVNLTERYNELAIKHNELSQTVAEIKENY